ncbi:glycosyltransferase family 2 protein [Anaeromicropila populeti]|uniref:glycosyltransferase family 2 protein n=1 Tax=Anaeromicropila populeti TaxID=37658 RepID=UPI0015A5EAC3|nr:galactosyltransferase-related protein [Anaeromicropila populeti]
MKHLQEKCVVHGKIYSISEVKFLLDPEKGIYYPYLNRTRSLSKAMVKVCVTEANILENFEETIGKVNRVTEMEKVIQEVLSGESGEGKWIGFTGGNCSIRRTAFLEAGGFDEKFGTRWGCEDFEFGYRLMQLGYDFIYSDRACNYHLMHYRLDFTKEHSLNVKYFYEKHNHENIIHLQEFVENKITVEQFVYFLTNYE